MSEKKEWMKEWKRCLKKGKNEWMKGSEEIRMKQWNQGTHTVNERNERKTRKEIKQKQWKIKERKDEIKNKTWINEW